MRPPVERLQVTLTLTERPDGGLRVTSDDVPGLLLSGSDREQVWTVVGPGVERLLRANRGLDVLRVVGPMTPPSTSGPVFVQVEHLGLPGRAAA